MAKTQKSISSSPVGISPAQMVKNANRWRDNYLVIRQLGFTQASRLLEQGERGEFTALQWAFRRVEKHNAVARAVLRRRRAALLKLDWDIKISDDLPKGVSKSLAEDQAATLAAAYNRIRNFKDALRHLSLAEWRGYSHLWINDEDGDGLPETLEPIDQWNFVRDGIQGDWAFNPEARAVTFDAIKGNVIDPSEWIIRTDDMPLDELALLIYVNKALAKRDWAAFIEIYGLPAWIFIMPPNLPPEKEGEFRDAAEKSTAGGSGALPYGSDAKPATPGTGTAPFEAHLKYEDSELVIAATSGKLTALAEAGSGTLAGGAHQQAFDDIAQAEGAEISEVFQTQLDRRILERIFPGQPILAYFELCSADTQGIQTVVDQAVKLEGVGIQMDIGQLSEKTGYTLERRPDPAPPAPGPNAPSPSPAQRIANRATGNQAATFSTDPLLRATAHDLEPVVAELTRIEAIADPVEQQTEAKRFLEKFGDLAREVMKNSAAEVEWEKLLGSNVVSGLTSA